MDKWITAHIRKLHLLKIRYSQVENSYAQNLSTTYPLFLGLLVDLSTRCAVFVDKFLNWKSFLWIMYIAVDKNVSIVVVIHNFVHFCIGIQDLLKMLWINCA